VILPAIRAAIDKYENETGERPIGLCISAKHFDALSSELDPLMSAASRLYGKHRIFIDDVVIWRSE
jgi:hypothetical protein